MSAFDTGIAAAKSAQHQSVSFAHLTPSARKDMVMEVLDEMHATNVQIRGDEVWHSCLLPFGNHAHGDRTGKCSINLDTLQANCWVCGGGSFMWWLASIRGDESYESVRDWVSSQINGVQSLGEILEFLDSLYAKPESRPAPPIYDPRVLDTWAFIHPYMTEVRGIPESYLQALHVGYDPKEQRIIIPHFWDGKLHGWQSRRLVDDGTPKYLSTPEMPKDTTLFRLPAGDHLILVESPMTVVKHANHPFAATFGAEVTQAQIDQIVRRYTKVTMWFDNDPAGWHATESVGQKLLPYMNVMAVENPYRGDPGDLSPELLVHTLDSGRVPFALWQRPKQETLNDPEVRQGQGS